MDERLRAENERLRAIIAMQSRMLDVAVSGDFTAPAPIHTPDAVPAPPTVPAPAPAKDPAKVLAQRHYARGRTRWSEQDEMTLLDLTAKRVSRDEIGRILGRSCKAVYKRQHELGIDG